MHELTISYKSGDSGVNPDDSIRAVITRLDGLVLGASRSDPRRMWVEFSDPRRASLAIVSLRQIRGVDVRYVPVHELSLEGIIEEMGETVLAGARDLHFPAEQSAGASAGVRWACELFQKLWSGAAVDATPPPPPRDASAEFQQGFRAATTILSELTVPFIRRIAKLEQSANTTQEPSTVGEVIGEMQRRLHLSLLRVVDSAPAEQHAGALEAFYRLRQVWGHLQQGRTLDELTANHPDLSPSWEDGFKAGAAAVGEVMDWVREKLDDFDSEPVFLD